MFHTQLVYTLLLPEGQTGEALKPSIKQCSLANREALDRKELSPFSPLKGTMA
jgi:hypothetical protein